MRPVPRERIPVDMILICAPKPRRGNGIAGTNMPRSMPVNWQEAPKDISVRAVVSWGVVVVVVVVAILN
jgi:hypothetical protein